MRNQIGKAVTVAAIVVGAAACSNQGTQETTTPDIQKSTGPQARMEPVTVTGCLKAGALAENTFVLTSAAEGGSEPATYQLVGTNASNLRDHVGMRMTVSGTVRSEEQIASSAPPAQAEAPRGTSGTPVVETKTELSVKQLEVNEFTPSTARCE